jgi:hypothetical protein
MNSDDQKIIHRWNHESQKSTWTTQSSNNVGKVLDHPSGIKLFSITFTQCLVFTTH